MNTPSHVRQRMIHIFLYFSCLLLSLTAIAKLATSFGHARVLQMPDPVFGMRYQYLLLAVGFLELSVAVAWFLGAPDLVAVGLIAWFSTGCVLYRVGQYLLAGSKPCPCLGNLTDTLGISPYTAEWFLKLSLGVLLAGSYMVLGRYCQRPKE